MDMEKSTKGLGKQGIHIEPGQTHEAGQTANSGSAFFGMQETGTPDTAPAITTQNQTPGVLSVSHDTIPVVSNAGVEAVVTGIPSSVRENVQPHPSHGMKPRPLPFWMQTVQEQKTFIPKSRNRVSFPAVRTEITHSSHLPDRLEGNEFDRTTRGYSRLAAMGIFKNCPEITSQDDGRPLRVLDVPTGTGTLVYDLRKAGIYADGVDMVLEEGQQREPFFMSETMGSLSALPEKYYDVALSLWGPLSYNYKGFDTQGALEELARLTRQGGKIIVAPIRGDAEPWLLDALGSRFDIQTHTIMVREFGNWGGSNTVYTVTV